MDAISSVKWIPAKVLVLDCIVYLFCLTNMPCANCNSCFLTPLFCGSVCDFS